MKVSKRKKIGASVDLTPMIDVVFQLILFFLVSTTFAVLPAINVNLPESSTARGEAVEQIIITVQEDGKIWFNDKSATVSTLGKFLSEFDVNEKKREEYPITIEADANVTNGTIVKIFDELRKEDFICVNLRTSEK